MKVSFFVFVAVALAAANAGTVPSKDSNGVSGLNAVSTGMQQMLTIVNQALDELEKRFGPVVSFIRQPFSCLDKAFEKFIPEFKAPITLLVNDFRKIIADTRNEPLMKRASDMFNKISTSTSIRKNVNTVLELEQKVFSQSVNCIKEGLIKNL